MDTPDPKSVEGFRKPGITLEGRVAQLFRLMGYNITRNRVVEGHEIDVFAEKEGSRVIAECKEYYSQLISRDLILIFATKVRDIMPDEAWFVTINDFESSALDLCGRYGIRAVTGYTLEEFEDQAIKNRDAVVIGEIPREDMILRRLRRRRAELSHEKRRVKELRHVVGQIDDLRVQRIELPPYLFPTKEGDLEKKYIWLSDVEKMPKIVDDGSITDIVVNIGGRPLVRGFKNFIEEEHNFTFWVLIFLIIVGIGAYYLGYIYLILFIIISGTVYLYREKLVTTSSKIINIPAADARLVSGLGLLFQTTTQPFEDDLMDYSFSDLMNLDMMLVDNTPIGWSKDFVVDKESWMIHGIQIKLSENISSDIGETEVIIPAEHIEFLHQIGKSEIKINALYVLSEDFLTEKKQI